jgi:dipeptidyl aminopeptidase/acylaminoacyl peptidase
MNDAVDRTLVDWLSEGPDRGPQHGLERALAATRRTSQRPRWTFPGRWLPMQLAMRPAASVSRQFLYLALIALLTVALALAALLVGSQRRTAPPIGLAGNGVVAFDRDGSIVVATPDGQSESELPTGVANARGPVFSPDGTRLAFYGSSGGGDALFVADADGRNAILVSRGIELDALSTETRPSFSPDGSRITFAGKEGEIHRVYVSATERPAPRAVTPADLDAIDPAWSPDGAWIAFQGTRPEEQSAAGMYRAVAGLYLVAPDGGSPRAIRQGEGGDFIYRKPQWRPVTDALMLTYLVGEPSEYDIAVLDVNSGQEDVISDAPTAEVWPVWSPDGSLLAWNAEDRLIRVAQPDGTAVVRLSNALDYDFVWSPDGTALYGGRFGGPGFFRIVRIDGTSEPVDIRIGGTSRSHWSWQRTAP